MSDRQSRAVVALLALAACGALAGCGKEERTVEITDVRTRKDAGPPAPEASTAERLQVLKREAPSNDLRWTWSTPAGWTETGGGQFREMGWTIDSSPDAQASFALASGGTLANLNRWRGQMGLAPVDAAAAAALEKRKFLGEDAVVVDLAGTFTSGGMAGPPKKLEGARMLGLIVEIQGKAAFLKLTGPAAVVDAEKERFFALSASIYVPNDPHAPPAPSTSPSAPMPPGHPTVDPPAGKAPFQWTAPEGWTLQPDKAMRIATFRPKDAKETEVVISRFPGAAGGLKDNVNRWRTQMGQAPLSDDDVAALPRAKALGRTAVLLSLDGDYGGMDGRAGKKGWTFLGAVIEGEDNSVFVKMVGPTAEVRPEEKRFREFVESLRE